LLLLWNFFRSDTPPLLSNQINHFVLALFDARKDLNAFKNTLRDFLVQLKEFAGDNDDLFLEEKEASEARRREEEKRKAMSIPGMIAPNDLPDEMVSEYS
jgi:exportin-1